METVNKSTGVGEKVVAGLIFMAIGSLVMVVFNPWHPLLDWVPDYIGRIVVGVLLLGTTFFLRKRPKFKVYLPIISALLILLTAVSLDLISGIYVIKQLGIKDSSPAGWAIQKFNEFIIVVSVVVLLTWSRKESLGAIYIQKGNLKSGLVIGLGTFLLAAAGSIPMAALFNGQDLTLSRITPWVPWILIFVLSNGAMEEILFRGLFLRKLQPFFGKFGSNLIVALVFTLMHRLTTYSADQFLFLAVLFPLALLWGYLMQKTDAVWASILFHAGMDIPIILGIFSTQF